LRRINEERMCDEHAHKEMIDPQLENAGWYLRDHLKK
jgi:type I site-specific restriction endonuclease